MPQRLWRLPEELDRCDEPTGLIAHSARCAATAMIHMDLDTRACNERKQSLTQAQCAVLAERAGLTGPDDLGIGLLCAVAESGRAWCASMSAALQGGRSQMIP
ncbi:hypothetical protein PSAC2689_240050 [Paraburkholderia sacchari]